MNNFGGAIETCSRCSKIYHYIGFGAHYCETCKELETTDFENVKNFTSKNPQCDLEQVIAQTGVSKEHIVRYLREGKIKASDDSSLFIKCEMCGGNIHYGRFCESCVKELLKLRGGI